MAGKACVLTTRRLHYGLDQLSKNALIDLVVDRARLEVGEDASDEQVAGTIQEWLGPVQRVREDRPINLVDQMAKLDANDEAYRNKTGKYRQVGPEETARLLADQQAQAALAAMVRAMSPDERQSIKNVWEA